MELEQNRIANLRRRLDRRVSARSSRERANRESGCFCTPQSQAAKQLIQGLVGDRVTVEARHSLVLPGYGRVHSEQLFRLQPPGERSAPWHLCRVNRVFICGPELRALNGFAGPA